MIVELIAKGIWTVATVFVLLYFIGLFYKPVRGEKKADNVQLIVVTIADWKVRNALLKTLNSLVELGLKPIVLTDEGAKLTGLIRDLGFDVIETPKNYRPDLIGKGRAINFFIENYVEDDMWYTFIDDDNVLFDLEFLYEIPEMEKCGYVAMNPVLVPVQGRSKITFVMDWVRFLDDIAVFRFFTGVLGKPLVGLHGELLTVKGGVLKDVGFDDASLTEDFLFASKLVKKGYKTWQSKTRVGILSPHSVSDFMSQRSRWFKGIFLDLFKPQVPIVMKVIVGIRIIMWSLGIFGSWLFMPLWFSWGMFYVTIPSAIAYWSIYVYGSYKLGDWKYVLLIPVYSIIESLSWVKALKRGRKFVVIEK